MPDAPALLQNLGFGKQLASTSCGPGSATPRIAQISRKIAPEQQLAQLVFSMQGTGVRLYDRVVVIAGLLQTSEGAFAEAKVVNTLLTLRLGRINHDERFYVRVPQGETVHLGFVVVAPLTTPPPNDDINAVKESLVGSIQRSAAMNKITIPSLGSAASYTPGTSKPLLPLVQAAMGAAGVPDWLPQST